MACFRPNPNDLTVRAVTKPFETAKSLSVQVDGETIQLRGKKGVVLERIPLNNVHWLPCSLPGGVHHCISLQFNEPQTKEIFLKAHSRSAVAHILTSLDTAAAKLTSRPAKATTVHAVARPPSEDMIVLDDSVPDPSPIDLSEQQESPDHAHSTARCPRCWQLAQLLDEHEAQTQDMEVLRADLLACREDLVAAEKEREAAVARAATAAANKARAAAQARQTELEMSLAEAAERCAKLLQELRMTADTADDNAAKCKELQAALATAEEEKKLLVEAMTTAQAQLHDAQEAFKQTASQLHGASKACAAAKSQATATRSELDEAREEAAKHAQIAQQVQRELSSLQAALEEAQRETAHSQQAWAKERTRLESALATLSGSISHDSSSGDYNGRAAVEATVLRAQVDELREQLSEARAAAAGREHEERADIARAAAQRAQNELEKTKKKLEEHYLTLQEEVQLLRKQASAAQLQAANSNATLDTERAAAHRAAEEVAVLRERLTTALTAQAAAVKERHGLEAVVDRLEVQVDRQRRKNETLEVRCKELEAKFVAARAQGS